MGGLSINPNAVDILERNLDKVDWDVLFTNPNAIHLGFTYDYLSMKEHMRPFAENLAQYVFYPPRLMRLCEKYNIELYDYNEIVG